MTDFDFVKNLKKNKLAHPKYLFTQFFPHTCLV